MLKKIMVAYDEGMVANRALDTAIELAQATSGEIHIVSAYMSVDNPTRREHLEKIQAEAVEKVVRAGIVVGTKIEAGDTELGQVIVKNAKELKVDIVVMGSNNRGVVGRFMFGSVSNYVLHNSGCPILIVK
jgi:nucleotide-binding universal stress UspA family protein